MGLNSDFPTIDPGTFRHQFTLLEPVLGADESGATVTHQAAAIPVTAWGSIDYIKGTDLIKSGQGVSQVYMKITAWWRREFTPNKRLLSPGGNQYVIQAVENVKGMNTFMVLMCLGIGSND